MNGYGFDVYFHINISNNLNLMIDSSTSVETKVSDFLTPEVNIQNQNGKVDISAVKNSTKVDQANQNKSFFEIIGKNKDEFRKIKAAHLQGVTTIKDPVDIHHNVYQVKFTNIDRILLESVKSGVVDYIIIRVGSEPDLKLRNSVLNAGEHAYDMMRLFLKPIKIDTPKTSDKSNADFELQCVSLTTYAMLYDKSFIGEIDGAIDQNNVTIAGATDVTVAANEQAANFKPIENFGTLNDIFNEVSEKTGVSINILQGFAVIESGMDPNSGNKASSAKGLYQFTNDTWKTMLKQHGAKYGYNSSTSVFNPAANTYMAAELLKSNQQLLRDLGQDSSVANLYLAHFLGSNDLRKIMNANPNTPAGDLLRRVTSDGSIHDPASSNKSVFYKNGRPITAGELISWAKKITNDKLGSYDPLDIDNESFGYGDFDLPIESMTSIMPRLESFENTTGKNFLKQVLNKLHIKYAVRYLNFNDAISPKSNFMYQKISIPSLNVIRLLEHVHEHFPPYMISVPWLFDDAHTNKDEGTDTNLGYSYYKEVNILNPDILKPRNMVRDSLISGNHIVYNITDAVRYYPKEIAYHYKSSSFTFTDFRGTVTNIPSEYNNSRMLIPKDNGSGAIVLDSVNINSSENISIEANYDALEFRNRLKYLFEHIGKDPTLLKVKIFGDFPAYIDFGYSYLLYSDQKSTIYGTPFKIVQNFQHKENGLVLDTEVIMYVTNNT